MLENDQMHKWSMAVVSIKRYQPPNYPPLYSHPQITTVSRGKVMILWGPRFPFTPLYKRTVWMVDHKHGYRRGICLRHKAKSGSPDGGQSSLQTHDFIWFFRFPFSLRRFHVFMTSIYKVSAIVCYLKFYLLIYFLYPCVKSRTENLVSPITRTFQAQ